MGRVPRGRGGGGSPGGGARRLSRKNYRPPPRHRGGCPPECRPYRAVNQIRPNNSPGCRPAATSGRAGRGENGNMDLEAIWAKRPATIEEIRWRGAKALAPPPPCPRAEFEINSIAPPPQGNRAGDPKTGRPGGP